ncbi:MAG: hypothetical protein K2J40_06770 [Ruminococcus sp.]|nr:hypothetical protein [Ruminococcus sp.]
MKGIDFLRQKSTRLVAFISACVIFAVCSAVTVSKWVALDNVYGKYEGISDKIRYSNPAHDSLQELFSELWLVGNMYFRYLDDEGNFTGSKELKASTETALKNLGLMDDKGNITISDCKEFDYYMSWGKNSISTGNRSYDDIFYSDDYSLTYTNGSITHSYLLGYFNYYSFKWYTTDYGMTYYDFPHTIKGTMAAATFDYDTKDLEYYTDNLGVKIYYKKDGSTPVPTPDTNGIDMSVIYSGIYEDEKYYYDEYGNLIGNRYGGIEEATAPNRYYDEYGNLIRNYEETIEETIIPKIPAKLLENIDDSSYIIYNRDSNEWVEVKNWNRSFGNEVPLKICITPSDEILPLYINLETEKLTAEKNMTTVLFGVLPFVAVAVLLMGFFVVTSGYDTKKKKFVLSSADNIWVEVVIAVFTLMICAAILSVDAIGSINRQLYRNYSNTASVMVPLYTAVWTILFALMVLCLNSIVNRFKCRSFWKTTFLKHIWKFVLKILKAV